MIKLGSFNYHLDDLSYLYQVRRSAPKARQKHAGPNRIQIEVILVSGTTSLIFSRKCFQHVSTSKLNHHQNIPKPIVSCLFISCKLGGFHSQDVSKPSVFGRLGGSFHFESAQRNVRFQRRHSRKLHLQRVLRMASVDLGRLHHLPSRQSFNLATRNKKLLGAPGLTTRSKDATRSKGHRY